MLLVMMKILSIEVFFNQITNINSTFKYAKLIKWDGDKVPMINYALIQMEALSRIHFIFGTELTIMTCNKNSKAGNTVM